MFELLSGSDDQGDILMYASNIDNNEGGVHLYALEK